jgi:hypothetical protein
MATDEQQFYQLLECLMSLDNNTRQQAEVNLTKKDAKILKFKLIFDYSRPHTEQYRLNTKLYFWLNAFVIQYLA